MARPPDASAALVSAALSAGGEICSIPVSHHARARHWQATGASTIIIIGVIVANLGHVAGACVPTHAPCCPISA